MVTTNKTTNQIHFKADDETLKMLQDASNYLKINLSAFIRQSSITEARNILKNVAVKNGTANNN